MHPLEISNLRKLYKGGTVEAVKGVSFNVNKGEIFGLLGPNGAGKTTIISSITTLEEPSSGYVKVFGEDVAKNPIFTKKQLGVVHQEIISSGFFDVEEILHFQSGYCGITKNKERIQFLLSKLALWEHRHKKVKQLSGGMKRRLMIAKALVHSPKLLLLDEPTAGVDITLRESLWDFVGELKKDGISILLTTHYLEEAEQLCDRIGIINLGELKVLGETKALIRQYTHKTVKVQLSQSYPVQSPYVIHEHNNELTLRVPHGKLIGEIMEDLKIPMSLIKDVHITEGNLEEAFLEVVNSKGDLT
jgi:ABC-type multidrug transport system, ATPase component